MMLMNTRGGLFGQTGRGGGVFSSEQRGFGEVDEALAHERAARMWATYNAERRRLGLGDEATDTSVVDVRGGVFGPGGHGGGIFDYATAFGAVAPGVLDRGKLQKAILVAERDEAGGPSIAVAAKVAGAAVATARSEGAAKAAEYAGKIKTVLDRGKKPIKQITDSAYYADLTKRLGEVVNSSVPYLTAILDVQFDQDGLQSATYDWITTLAESYKLKTKDWENKLYASLARRDPKSWGGGKGNSLLAGKLPKRVAVSLLNPAIHLAYEDWRAKDWGPLPPTWPEIPESSPMWDWLWQQMPEDQRPFLQSHEPKTAASQARAGLLLLPAWFRDYVSVAKGEAADLVARKAASEAEKLAGAPKAGNWWPWIIAAGVATVGVGVLVSREKKAGAV